MEQEYMSSKPIASPEPLSLPHFDEEATLLSARPVVPLHEVRAETRSKRRLIFVSTIVAGFVLGALGASMLFMPGDKQTNSVAEGEQSLSVNPVSDSFQHNQSGLLSDTAGQSPNGGSPSGQAVNSSQAAALTALTKGQIDPTSASAGPSRTPNLNRGQAPRTSSAARPTRANPTPNNSVETLPTTQPDDQDLEIDQGRLRRAERREERRLRRERRNSSEQSSDDLMRINEIFEGTPRP
jgi:hypothetical protein